MNRSAPAARENSPQAEKNSNVSNTDRELELAHRGPHAPARLPWCETEEDYEAVMSDLAAQESRWA